MEALGNDIRELASLKARWMAPAPHLEQGSGTLVYEVLKRLQAGLSLDGVAEKMALGDHPAGYDLRGIPLGGQDVRVFRVDATYEGVDLSGAYLQGADLSEARLQGAILRDAHLGGADLWGCDLSGADLSGAHLEKAKLWDADLKGAFFQEGHLQGADLRGANLQEANLRGAHLAGAGLWDADLRSVDLRDAHLEGADLTGADLRRANFWNADLRGADLSDTQLQDANLRDVNLEDVDLRETNLEGVDLRGVRFGRLKVSSHGVFGPSGMCNFESVTGGIASRADIFRIIKNKYKLVGEYEEASRYYYLEMVTRRREFFDEKLRRQRGQSFWGWMRKGGLIRNLARWIFSKLYDVLCSYGERPFKALVVSLIWILLNGGAYFISEGDFSRGFDLTRGGFGGLWQYARAFGHWLCFSTAVFSGAEYGPWPQGWAAPLSALEPVAGIVLFSIFLATLARKMIRDD
ncbi:MAG: pentapeptide repeat-containing protein [Candidatus Latescibacterota bacterium]